RARPDALTEHGFIFFVRPSRGEDGGMDDLGPDAIAVVHQVRKCMARGVAEVRLPDRPDLKMFEQSKVIGGRTAGRFAACRSRIGKSRNQRISARSREQESGREK